MRKKEEFLKNSKKGINDFCTYELRSYASARRLERHVSVLRVKKKSNLCRIRGLKCYILEDCRWGKYLEYQKEEFLGSPPQKRRKFWLSQRGGEKISRKCNI